jgi:ATP-binding cassette subfamily F protein 3
MEAEIVAQIPNIDPLISKYACGYLEHAVALPDSDSNASSALTDSLTALLVSASGDLGPQNETTVRNLVDKLVSRLSAENGVDGERRQTAPSARRLDQTIHVGSQRNISSTLALAGGSVDLEAAAGRKVESRVDRKKLEKAERKIRAKQERKVMKNVEYEASRLLNQTDETQSYEEFYMQVNPLQLGADAATKSKDIKVDGIDVSIGGKRILLDTNLTLAYGRRYGLVGQNGIGKSTLLRALSRREIAIPTHISILHVEQEVRLIIKQCRAIKTKFHRSLETIHPLCRPSWMPMSGGSTCSRNKRSVSSLLVCCECSLTLCRKYPKSLQRLKRRGSH